MHHVSPARPATLGRRESKRLATRRAIEVAALELAAERGFDDVTVDDISARAGVSARTFFNYFATKEASVGGDTPFVLTEASVERYVEHPQADPLADLVELIATSIAGVEDADPELYRLRRSLVAQSPAVLAVKFAQMRELEAQVIDAVARRLNADASAAASAEGRAATGDDLVPRARTIAMVAMALMRSSSIAWAEHPEQAPAAQLLRESLRLLRS
ncbi:TetR family transcriptional regulator [Cnuibacter sp. UC19_7]|uniref:TetR family transcriptional regulator n=1 Tax=Cnuibacter sp. UC19_7 TaxID=3350166 RepID=UPI00366F7368